MLLSPLELAALADRIRKAHLGLAVAAAGPDLAGVTEDEFHQLVAGGWVRPDETSFIQKAWDAGRLNAWQQERGILAPQATVAGLNLALQHAAKNGLKPLGPAEAAALEYAKIRGATYIKGLGNRLADDFTTLAIETELATRKALEAKVRDTVGTAILNRETAQKLASRLGDAMGGDWSRDLRRIAMTETQGAYCAGWSEWYKETSGPETRVAKRPSPGACPRCVDLYTENGQPRIFILADLEANGSNHGRKAADWLPTVGPVHPWCACVLIRVPVGFGFNDQGQMVPSDS